MTHKDFTGGGDPQRSLGLLWGRQETGRRGPKPRFSAEKVVAAATAIADAEGLPALSMRRVAEAMGVSAMSLYTYVPSKAELVDLMFDRAMGAVPDPDDDLSGWRARLTFIARQRWALAERHPWVLDLALHRPPLGPNVLKKAEATIQALDGMGLAEEEMTLVAEVLQNYIAGALQVAREARDIERRSGITDEQWLELIEPVLQQHVDPATYPALSRIGEGRRKRGGGGLGASLASFEFGLERVLDGLEAYIRERHALA
ncbi:TetR/AcrR family transcriptional regulator [uncultured Phenylobacterium sp.]|uniref:TetR/AcrR family transcriptional regulator n=1 Tax=uncultured Phenylobacterium sp. TaxID=349273 RepID=UPI0025E01815|nr:TetR/AcrR family transcriptional regulator [uncultured Phenylobacterium sp.]